MKEDRAPAATSAWADVPVHDDADIVDIVIAPHLLMAGFKGQIDGTVIIGVIWRIAPAIQFAHASHRQAGQRQAAGIAAAIAIEQSHGRKRRRAVALALESTDSPLAKRAFQHQIASSEQAARLMAGLCPYIDDANSAAFLISGQACLLKC